MSTSTSQQIETLQQAKLKMFSIFDSARKSYLAPMLFSTVEEAKRYFADTVKKNPESLFALYPDYYSLCEIGVFDPAKGTGKFNLIEKRHSLPDIIKELNKNVK